MSCHTWIYQKLSKVSNDKITELCNSAIKSIDNYWVMNEELDVYVNEMITFYHTNKSREEIICERDNIIKNYELLKSLLKTNNRKNYIKYLIKDLKAGRYIKNNGEYYILIQCDSFRFSHYTERKFKSANKLIKYFSKRNFEGCSIDDINGKSEKLLQAIHHILDSGDCIIEFG